MEALAPSLETVKLCIKKIRIQNWQKSDLKNFGNFVELLGHRV